MYNNTLRAMEILGLADIYGNSRIPIYVLNVTYPLVDDEFVKFCAGKKSILLIEEGQPEFHRAECQHHPASEPTCRPGSKASRCCRWPANIPAAC